ncbi:MAG TPA: hypothetical protein VD968_10680 [Pyrinomonadaceae bacterium]|nr:hypothetical protein [Pyrinomonadaceae bacterium]
MTANIARAKLVELTPKGVEMTDTAVEVQFNPETLSVVYSNSVVTPAGNNSPKTDAGGGGGAVGDQRGSAAMQHTGQGTTRFSVQLWFDVTGVLPQAKQGVTDVRDLTKDVVYFIKSKTDRDPPVPPMMSFQWGSFRFDGIVQSVDETLEFFSANGTPLRAKVGLSMQQSDVVMPAGGGKGLGPPGAPGGGAASPGTKPLFQAQAGLSLQASASASFGASADWQAIATANNIENPRFLEPGQLIDMNAKASASASASASLTGSASASFELG